MGTIKELISNLGIYIKTIKKYIPDAGVFKIIATIIDLFYWVKKHHILHSEYFLFGFYNLSDEEKKEYIFDWGITNVLKKFNSDEVNEIMDSKYLFNKNFSEYLARDYEYISKLECDYQKISAFINKHPKFMVKPLSFSGGYGIHDADLSGTDLSSKTIGEFIKSEFERNDEFLIEEFLTQHPDMAALNPDSINTCRVVTMRDRNGVVHVVFANVRVGRTGGCIDNFCAGGVTAAIDVKTGIVSSDAFDIECKTYAEHPDTKIKFIGYQIPCWDTVIETVCSACNKFPGARLIGWDVCIMPNGKVAFIEANHRPGARIHQIPAKKGLKHVYREYLGDF